MKTIKQILAWLWFTAFILKFAYIFGFFVGIFKAFLSYFCYIWVSSWAINLASVWVVNVGIILFAFWVYDFFFNK